MTTLMRDYGRKGFQMVSCCQRSRDTDGRFLAPPEFDQEPVRPSVGHRRRRIPTHQESNTGPPHGMVSISRGNPGFVVAALSQRPFRYPREAQRQRCPISLPIFQRWPPDFLGGWGTLLQT